MLPCIQTQTPENQTHELHIHYLLLLSKILGLGLILQPKQVRKSPVLGMVVG